MMRRRTSFYGLVLEDEIEIAAQPEAAWLFFEEMEANYTRWHPDHLRFEWRGPKGLAVGNEFYFEETIAGKMQRKLTRITEAELNRGFAFTMVNPLFRLFLPHLSFTFVPIATGFRFRGTIRLRGIGPLGERLNAREFDAVERHMAEEGTNLKALLEAGQRGGDASIPT